MIRASHVVPAVLAEVLRKAPLCAEKVTFAWERSVGPVMQRSTTVRLDADGVLHVLAADAHWGLAVKRSSKMISARLATLLGVGVVKRLHVRVDSSPCGFSSR